MGVAGGLSLSAKYFLLKQESVSYRSRACLFWLVRVPRKLFVLGIGQTSVLLCQHFSKHFSTVGSCLTNKHLSWRNRAFRTSSYSHEITAFRKMYSRRENSKYKNVAERFIFRVCLHGNPNYNACYFDLSRKWRHCGCCMAFSKTYRKRVLA